MINGGLMDETPCHHLILVTIDSLTRISFRHKLSIPMAITHSVH